MTPRRTQPPATLASFTRDPFEACQHVWAHNLLAAACPGHPTPRAVQRFENEALLMLLVRTSAGRARGRQDQTARLTAAEVAAYLRRAGRDLRTPPPPEEPLASGLKVLAALLGLGELELRLLTFALASEHNRPVLELFMALGGGSVPLGTLMAAAVHATGTDLALFNGATVRRRGRGLDDAREPYYCR